MAERKTMSQYEAAHRKRTIVSSVMILVMIPVTTLICAYFLGTDLYMVSSLIILIYTMIPFFMVFEKRKPKAREIVLIAMMTAITVCAQMFFHLTVPVQIGTALIIISGISLGPEAGFLVGALGRFVCNFYMGQGPWTPWQMFCWGILGFLAGLAFNKVNLDKLKSRSFSIIMGPVMSMAFALAVAYLTYLFFGSKEGSFVGWRLYAFGAAGLLIGVVFQRKRLPVDGITIGLFTFFTTFVVYGGIMNVSAMVTASIMPGGQSISIGALRTLYLTGAPYDAFHAGTAAICVFLFGDSIIRKLERIKIKYGIYR